MNKIYDNGEIVLGAVAHVRKYLVENAEETWEIEDILEDIKDLTDDTIVAINYDHGMGYSVDWWTRNNIVKEYNNYE